MSGPRTAIHDRRLSARVVARSPLGFAGGADEPSDRPAHVRAGSGLAPVPEGLIVVQDDSNFLALIDPASPGAARAIALPAGPDGRRQFGDSRANKHLKLDLEACIALEPPYSAIVALGSGSTPARESIVVVRDWNGQAPAVRVVRAQALYAALREVTTFSGSEMNIEGAVLVGGVLRLFGRGNGMATGTLQPVNATCDLQWLELWKHLESPDEHPAPPPRHVQQFSLGQLDGVPLGFTDAAHRDGQVLFTAAAEASPDAVRDGTVHGSVVGVIAEGGAVRWTPIVDEMGALLREKAEGLALADSGGAELWVIADADEEMRPSELLRVRLDGPWRDGA